MRGQPNSRCGACECTHVEGHVEPALVLRLHCLADHQQLLHRIALAPDGTVHPLVVPQDLLCRLLEVPSRLSTAGWLADSLSERLREAKDDSVKVAGKVVKLDSLERAVGILSVTSCPLEDVLVVFLLREFEEWHRLRNDARLTILCQRLHE
jgi:hypothetical protein